MAILVNSLINQCLEHIGCCIAQLYSSTVLSTLEYMLEATSFFHNQRICWTHTQNMLWLSRQNFQFVKVITHTSGIRLSLLRADLFLFSFTMMSRSHWRDRTTSRHHSPSGGNEWAKESVGKKLKPEGGRFKSSKPMCWSLKKRKKKKELNSRQSLLPALSQINWTAIVLDRATSRPDLEPNICPSGPLTQSISTFNSLSF